MSRKKRIAVVLFTGVIFVLTPILIMANCAGFNEGSMQVRMCGLDFPMARQLANFFYSWIVIAAFLAGIPIFIYLAVVVGLMALMNWLIKPRHR